MRTHRSGADEEALTRQYQQLLRLELTKLGETGENFQDAHSFLEDADLAGLNSPELVERGLLVPFPDNKYRTTHVDLIFRLVNIRNRQTTAPIPLEFRLERDDEPVPDFGAHPFHQILSSLVSEVPEKNLILKILLTALPRGGLLGLSSYQLPVIKELVNGKSRDVAVVAPTASGKTITFFLPVLIKAIQRTVSAAAGVSSILVYPRRALGRDQMQAFLTLVDSANETLRAAGFGPITIGIDDRDTPRRKWITDGSSYRALRCVGANCRGGLVVSLESGKARVHCDRCNKEYEYIIPTKEDVWENKPRLLITNLYIVYRRLMSSPNLALFESLDYAVIDEAHVYTNFVGGHIHYILKMLKYVSRLKNADPVFVYSSATIPNPQEFVSQLAGIDSGKLHYLDFYKTLSQIPGLNKRIMLHLYLLPHPSSNIETLTEALILAVSLWSHRHSMKAITFIDSVAEINTMTDYLHATILGRREGREVTDHIFEAEPKNLNNDYYWYSIAPDNTRDNLPIFKTQVLTQIKESIDMHYGGLGVVDRARLESEFKSGSKRMLLSTSTLELGIDLSDVACIIQHKLPITPEGVVQRVGRSGRSSACYRIALGIVALPTLPLSTLYLYNDVLRKRLESSSQLPPLRLGMSSHNIGLQYTLSQLLLMRALDRKPTYIDAESGSLFTELELVEAIRQLKEDCPKLILFNKSSGILTEDALTTHLASFSQMIETFLRGYAKVHGGHLQLGESELISGLRARIESQISKLTEASDELTNARRLCDKVDIFGDAIRRLEKYSTIFDDVRSRLIELNKSIRWATENRDPSVVRKWEMQHLNNILTASKQIPTTDDVSQLLFEWSTKIHGTVGGFPQFRKRYAIDFNQITKSLTAMGSEVGSGQDQGFVLFFQGIPEMIRTFRGIDFDVIDTSEALARFAAEVKVRGYPLDIFDALSLVFEGRAYFSLLLQTPAPDMELVGVDDA